MARTKKISSDPSPAAKRLRRKPAAPAAPAPKTEPVAPAAVAPKATPAPTVAPVSPEERHRMIAEAAYYIALRKGFNSDPRENWIEAEAEITARLKAEGRG